MLRWAAYGMLLGLVLLAGCAGYQLGTATLYAPHLRTVYVPMFESDIFRRNLGERLTEAVMKEIEAKTPYKVVGTPDADSVLTGRIVAETKRAVVEDFYDHPRQLEANVQVRVRWADRYGNQIRQCEPVPLPEALQVSGTAPFFPEVGQSMATAHQRAIQRVAEQIVAMMESPW